MTESINNLTKLAGQYAQQSHALTGTIVKELLHYEILYGLSRTELKRHLIFQGGTALRLCYGGNRYSEDLDFVLDGELEDVNLEPLMELLQKQVARQYGLEVRFKLPKEKNKPNQPEVRRWQVVVQIPAPRHVQKINIEVCEVPSHDNGYHLLQANYPHLPQAYRQITLRVETPVEIFADKIVALGARNYLKARDIWDIHFLKSYSRSGIVQDSELVRKKLVDYRIDRDEFRQSLEQRIFELDTISTHQQMLKELSRFLDPDFFDTILTTGLIKQLAGSAMMAAREFLDGDA